MSKKGSLKKFLSVIVAVMIIISSLPISSAYAAIKETEECVDCSGSGTVACTDCVGGYKSTNCTLCGGTGLVEADSCEACNGTGKEKCETCVATGFVECLTCNGTGEIEVEYEICPVCNGDKKCTTCAGGGSVKIPCTNSSCNNGKIDVDCSNCEDGKIEVSCSNCSGTGKVSKIVSTPCTACGGTGLLADDSDCPDCEDGMVESLQDVDCDQCVAGKIEQDCSTCGAVGTIQQNCTICGGTGEIDSVCSECSGDKKCSNCLGIGKIKTVEDTSFSFNEATPSSIKVGDTFENIASSSNNTTGTVSYEVDDDTIAVITNDGKLTAKRVGTVTVTAKIVTDYTFSSAEAVYTITIDKATPVISGVSATAITYGQKLSDSTVSAVAKVGTTEIAGHFAWADSVKNEKPTVVTDSDNTEYEAVFTPDDTDNYTTATFKGKVTVNKADITGITVTGCNHVYDGTAVDAVSVSGLEASDKVKYSTDNGNTYQTSMPKLTNVNDSKTVYVSVSRDGNYNDYVTSVAAEVNPAKIDGVSFDVYSGTYDGTEHQAVTLSGDGYKDGDTVTYKYEGNTYTDLRFKDAGEYEVEVTISRADENYKDTKFPEETDAKFKVVISKADVTVKANNVSKEYTGEVLTSSNTEASISGEVEGHTFTAQINGSGTTVNEYTLAPSNVVIRDAEGNDVTKNYNISTENGILEITKRPLKITAKNVDAIYNAKPYGENGYLQEGLVEGQTIESITIAGEKNAVGSYLGLLVPSGAVIKSGDEETTYNYDIEYVSGDMTIGYLEIADVNDVYTVNDANDFGWYNDKVILTAKDGYKLCYSNDNADSFTGYVEYTTEGVTNPKVAVMEIATGYITDILDCNQVKIDTVNPNVFNIEYKTPLAYKLLETVTFGIYNAPTVATVYASDATSNIKSVSYKLTGADYVDVDVADMTFDEGKYSYEIVIPKSFKGQVQYYATDNSGLKSEIKSDDNGIIVDVTDPAINEIDYNTTIFRDSKYYYSGDAVVDFAVNEEYFFAEYMDSAKIDLKAIDSAVTVKVTKNGEDYTNFENVLDENSKTISVKIPSVNNDGDYVIDLTYTDPAENSVNVKTDTLVIDTTAPAVTVSYDNNTPSNEKYFNTDRVATITVVEHNFFAEDFIAEFEAKDIKGNDVIFEDFAAKLKNDDEWKHEGDIHIINLEYTVDANYTYSFIGYKDAAENDNEYSFADGSVATNNFVIDHIKPTDVEITYSGSVLEEMLGAVTFGFYKEKCEVTLTTTDATSPIDYFSYSYDVNDPVNTGNVGGSNSNAVAVVDADDVSKFTSTFEIPAQFRGQVQATATDMATNESNPFTDAKTIVTDTISPVMSVSYPLADNTKNGVDYYNKDVKVTLNVTDENFMDGEYPSQVNDIVISANIEDENKVVTNENYSVTNWTRINNTDEWQGTFTLSTEGDYTLSISYTDKSGNAMADYSKDKLTIDKTKPMITVSYDNNTPSNEKYFNTDRVATITVVEHNFFAEDFIAEFEAKDIKGNDVIFEDFAAKLKNDDEWKHEGDIHIINLEYTVDANYTYSFIGYKDAAENDNEYSFADGSVATNNFVIDHIKPTDVEITYSGSVLEEMLGAVTFGFYKEKCEVTLTTTDATSPIDYFSYSYDVNDPVNTGNVGGSNSNAVAVVDADDVSKFTSTFEIPAQFRGQVQATATDMATNESNPFTDAKTIVTDTISPVMSVSYPLADNTKNGVDYYNKDVKVTLNVTDENFMDGEYPSQVNDIVISANIEDENKVVTNENYSVTNWTRINNTDEWQGTFTLSTEGDYTLSISYTDKSGNAMADYTKDKFTIDKTKPVITAEYNTPVQKVSKDGNEVSYYNNTVGMKLTVVEHNFDASYFASKISATDVNNNIISEANEAIQKFVEKDSNWSSSLDGNTHTIVVPIEDVEANYLVDYELCDLAINYADRPTAKKLTYDITNPEIELSIKATVVRKILNGVTFGIFDKNVNADITITATDEISGIERIEYSTYATQNVIGKIDNTKLDISNVIIADNIQTSDGVTIEQENGKQVVKYKFTVAPEFRNKIMSTAYDYSTNSSMIDNIINHEDGLNFNGVIKDVEESKIELSVDESAPYASIDTFADNFNFYVNISDTNAGIAKIEADINGKPILVDNANNVISNIYAGEDIKDNLIESAVFAINTSQADKANDGVYVLTVKVTDNANNTISKSYTAYIDVWSPMVTDFSFESSGKAYTGNDAYIYGEKVDVIDKDTNIYNYYFENTTKVTVYVYDYEKSPDASFNQHTAGIKDVKLIAENKDGVPVSVRPVENSFVQTTEDGIGYSKMTYVIEGPFKGDLYAIASDYAGNYPSIAEEHGYVAPGYKSMISDKHDGYVNPYDVIIENIDKHISTSSISIVPKTETKSTQNYSYQYKYEGEAQVRDEESKIDYLDSQNVPLYNSNVEFDLTVEDKYSGIKQVKWSVIGQEDQDFENNQEGTVTFGNDGQIVSGGDSGWTVNSEDSNLVTSISKQITVNNDSNDIVILVELTDRAGNTSYDYYVLGIDKTAAKVTVELDKNASNGKYFNESRVVTVTVEERNFDPASFDLTIKKNDDATPSVNGAKLKWNHSAQDFDAVNETTHVATYTISPDGDYKIEASNIDIAGNETNNKSNVKPMYKGDAPTDFIIDKTQPEINVSMTGTSKNEKYFFNEDRTVTIVVTDRNFNPNDVSLRITSNGAVYSPKLNWKQDQSGSQRTNATTNTATFTISNEADYTFNFSCVDKAQNASKSTKYATEDCQKFTIDKTAPTVVISQIVYQSANNGRDDQGNEIEIPLTVTVKDTNIGNLYNNNSVTSKEVSEKLNVSQLTGISTDSSFKQSTASRDTIIYTTSNIKNDGIYNLNLDIQDCAGNKMNSISYNSSKDKSSTQTVSNGNSNFFTFSVNRNGSTYGIDENTANLVKTYYVQNVTHDVKILETNVDKLVGKDLKSNVKVLKDGQVDSSVSSFVKVENISTSTSWQKYTYIIDKAYFEPEATYEISIQSMDTANNAGYSDLKLNSDSIKFVVDRTVPVVSIVGITSDTSYFKDSQDVSITISDDVFLSKIQIFINDNIELELEAKDFGDYFVDGKFVWNYTVNNDDGTNKISVVCYDAAGNANTDENEVAQKSTIENFLVTTNRGEIAKFWIINNVVQTAIIAVVIVGTVAGIVWFVLYRKKFRKTSKK